ncbi:MAG: helix-turn-helix transcriptional regulator [Candidatus Zhuqueibacterota bacterium]
MHDEVKYLTEKQVAEITKFALSTLRNYRFLGKGIPYIKIGKSVRYNYTDVIEYMESFRVNTKQREEIRNFGVKH